MGTILQAASRTIRLIRSTTAPGANATTTYIAAAPCAGWGTCRIECFTDQQVTLNLLQKPANGNPLTGALTPTFTMRQTDTRTIAASPTTQANDFNIRGDYLSVQVVATTAPTVWEIEVTLFP